MSVRRIAVGLLATVVSSAALLSASGVPKKAASQAAPKQAATKGSLQSSDEGQRIFEQNCSRCHTAPDGFSSRISGTITRHMRVRANLSKHDEEELLRFFNP